MANTDITTTSSTWTVTSSSYYYVPQGWNIEWFYFGKQEIDDTIQMIVEVDNENP